MNKVFNFGSEYNDSYVVVVNGNNVVFSNFEKKTSLRYAKRSASRGDYVELWYQHGNGQCVLVSYWN